MKEVLGKNDTSAHISPSNKGKGLLFSANLPPFDPQEEGHTEEDKYLANSGIKTPATQISAFIENQIGAISTPAALGIGLGGVAVGAGGAFLYEKVFAAEHEVSINSFPNSFNNEGNKIVDKRDRFDNTATKGIVGPNNILVVPREVFDKTPIADEQGNPIFDFPWDPNHPMEIKYYKITIDDQIAWLKSNGLTDADNYKGYQSDMYSDNPLPAGFEFPTIYPGRLFFMGSVYDEEASGKSPSNPYGLAVYKGPITMAKIEFIAPNGILYFVNINIIDDSGGREKDLPILPLIDAPLIGHENGMGKDWGKGTPVEKFQKIFRVQKEGKLKMGVLGGKNGSLLIPKDTVPGNFRFITGKDQAGIEKILVSDIK